MKTPVTFAGLTAEQIDRLSGLFASGYTTAEVVSLSEHDGDLPWFANEAALRLSLRVAGYELRPFSILVAHSPAVVGALYTQPAVAQNVTLAQQAHDDLRAAKDAA